MANGIVAWGAYLPYWRLRREAIGDALGIATSRGERTVASYDEDTTSMAVEAARSVVLSQSSAPALVTLSTSAPAYLDKNDATALHAALGLPTSAAAFDVGGSVRSAAGAMALADAWSRRGEPALATMADIRTGLPGGGDERDGGDGAAAFLFGTEAVAAEVLAWAHVSEEILERWRVPGAASSDRWEERFGEHAYGPMGEAVVADALKEAGLAADELDHVVVAGPHGRATRRLASTIGARHEALAPDLARRIGNTGAAQVGISLCDVLDRAEPDETILVVSLSDGADALVLRATGDLAAARERLWRTGAATVAAQVETGRSDLPYNAFLTWRDVLHREPPRRPDPEPPAAPPSRRAGAWKFGFNGSRCHGCGTLHLPPARVCSGCAAVDEMATERVADATGTVATFTVDRLAFSLSPPVVAAVIDFDGGGRFSCELTDLDPAEVEIGLRVRMTFRKLHTANGVHNYFWKAKPVRSAHPIGGED
ncbi:MAG TPA: OB-fold domain-containing protein [Acidimicrobiales bacterium]|nr:OB-fold domain-containing protein [Acidimicrobiales bacterium]